MKNLEKKSGRSLIKESGRRRPPRKNDIVLLAAEEAFVKHGFAGTSVDAIAALAGVSKRTVYSNFETKRKLYAEVIRKRCNDVVPAEIAVEKMDADPEKVLFEVSLAFLQALYAPEQIALYQTIVMDSRLMPDAGQMMFDGPVMQSQTVFDHYFRHQSRRGVMRFPNLDLAGAQFVALLKGNTHMRLMLHQPTPLPRKKLEDIVRSSIALFLHGALVREKP